VRFRRKKVGCAASIVAAGGIASVLQGMRASPGRAILALADRAIAAQ
jgi:hypothetical protein